MLLCCRRWNSCRMSCSSSPRRCRWLPSRLSKCPRSCLTMFLRDVCVATRSWRNSWWKCRRFSDFSSFGFSECCRTLTFQFRMVVVELLEVFKAFSPGHSSLERTANKIADIPAPRSGVSGVFKVFFLDRVQQRLLQFGSGTHF